MMSVVRRVAEGLLQELFPREEHEATAAQAQRFKGMVKKDNPPACSQLVSCQEFHLPLIECALQVVYYIVAPQVQPSIAALPCHMPCMPGCFDA